MRKQTAPRRVREMFRFSWDNFSFLHLFLPPSSSLLDLYKGVFPQAKNTFFWPMKEKMDGNSAFVFLWVSRYLPVAFISSFNKWCHGSLNWDVAKNHMRLSGMFMQRTVSPFLLFGVIPFLCGCWCHAELGYLWHCHLTDVLCFPAANLRCGNNDLKLHFPPLLELNPVILLIRYVNGGYSILFSLVKCCHHGWWHAFCHAGGKPPPEGRCREGLEFSG